MSVIVYIVHRTSFEVVKTISLLIQLYSIILNDIHEAYRHRRSIYAWPYLYIFYVAKHHVRVPFQPIKVTGSWREPTFNIVIQYHHMFFKIKKESLLLNLAMQVLKALLSKMKRNNLLGGRRSTGLRN